MRVIVEAHLLWGTIPLRVAAGAFSFVRNSIAVSGRGSLTTKRDVTSPSASCGHAAAASRFHIFA